MFILRIESGVLLRPPGRSLAARVGLGIDTKLGLRFDLEPLDRTVMARLRRPFDPCGGDHAKRENPESE